MLKKKETWRDSFKNLSQWVNTLIGVLGSSYLMMTQEMREDLSPFLVGFMSVMAFANIVVRNWPQNKS